LQFLDQVIFCQTFLISGAHVFEADHPLADFIRTQQNDVGCPFTVGGFEGGAEGLRLQSLLNVQPRLPQFAGQSDGRIGQRVI
jgi:hypothetical protein